MYYLILNRLYTRLQISNLRIIVEIFSMKNLQETLEINFSNIFVKRERERKLISN